MARPSNTRDLARWMAEHPGPTVAGWLGAFAALSLPTVAERGASVESFATLVVMATLGAVFGGFWTLSAARWIEREQRRYHERSPDAPHHQRVDPPV